MNNYFAEFHYLRKEKNVGKSQIMHNHTIIFKTGQLIVPDKIDKHFLLDLIKVGQLELDYFGIEIDNQNENEDETTLLELFFDTNEPLDYSMQESEVKHLIYGLIEKEKLDIRSSDNDITVYL